MASPPHCVIEKKKKHGNMSDYEQLERRVETRKRILY
jgi:hypothetical protein